MVAEIGRSGDFLWALQSTPSPDKDGGSGLTVFWLSIFLIWVGFAVFFWYQRRPFDISVHTSARANDVLDFAIRAYVTQGWSVTSNTGSTVTFYKNLKPSCLVAILLFALGFVPGLIYLFIGGRDLTATINAREMKLFTTAVHIAGNAQGFGAIIPAKQIAERLPPLRNAQVVPHELDSGSRITRIE